jgi:hypothetical protein
MIKHGILAIRRIQIQIKYLLAHCASTTFAVSTQHQKQWPPLPGTPMGTNANLNFKDYIAQYDNHSKTTKECSALV